MLSVAAKVVLVPGIDQSKTVPDSQPESIIPVLGGCPENSYQNETKTTLAATAALKAQLLPMWIKKQLCL